jgi:hypothetical protein
LTAELTSLSCRPLNEVPAPDEDEIQKLNPGRAINGLEQRGFALRDHCHRKDNIALTVEGFIEARRLGGVRASEIVDLDQAQANWRAPEDFLLGAAYAWHRDDDPPWEDLHPVVSQFDHVNLTARPAG